MSASAFSSPRTAALALLNSDEARLTRQAGSFLGQICVDDRPLSKKQFGWISTLLDRAGLPCLADGMRS